MNHPIQAVLFDLDGTLADTAHDLAAALNATLKHFDYPELAFEQIRPAVSHGGIALIQLGFQQTPETEGFEEKRRFLLDYYQNNICRHTRLFDGMDSVLSELESRQIPWGIVTNKPSWLTDPLISAMSLKQRSAVTISGDTLQHNKPHPLPLLTACERIGIKPENTLYVGDAERDIKAANNAGMKSLVALFGYIDAHDEPEHWGTPHMIHQATDILNFIQ
jgi:phosphoglycolate phosphatase